MITDGRDTPAKIALTDLQSLEQKCSQLGLGKVASVAGRYFAMDRDKNWDRTKKAYDAFILGKAPVANSAAEAIQSAYNQKKTDEFIEPVQIANTPRITDGDSIVFFNYRSDRAKQISASLIDPDFKDFNREKIVKDFYFVSFTSYGHESTPKVKVAFFAEKVINPLSQIIADNNLGQIHAAETEKYAHVTYFFNAGVEKAFNKEERILVNSPKVATYDLKPEMSVFDVVGKFKEAYSLSKPAFSVINFANADMVGHTGVMEATQKAIMAIDKSLGELSNFVLSQGANLIVTADHGNAEQMINPQSQQPDKEHTTNSVPLILALAELKRTQILPISLDYKVSFAANAPVGVLSDVTTTVLDILGLPKITEMTGQSLKGLIN